MFSDQRSKVKIATCFAAALILSACAVPTTGVVPRNEGLYTVTRQGSGFWVTTESLRNDALIESITRPTYPATYTTTWPASMVMQRWQRAAIWRSWVTSTSAVPRSWFSSNIRAMMRSPVAKSRLPVGSSASSTIG